MRKGECEDSDDGQQQGSIVNVRFTDDDVDGSNHVNGDNEE